MILVKLVFLLISSSSAMAGIRDVGNGAGAHEQMLLYTWTKLPDLLAPCLAEPSCYESDSIRDFGQILLQSHATEVKDGGLLFAEQWSGAHGLIAETETQVGDPLLFNQKELGKNPSFTFNEALNILILLLGHHHDSIDSKTVNSLAQNLSRFWNRHVEERSLKSLSHYEIAVLLVTAEGPSQQEVLIGDGLGFQKIDEIISSQLPCPKDFTLTNPHWLNPKKASNQKVILTFEAQLTLSCNGQILNGFLQVGLLAEVESGTADDFLHAPNQHTVRFLNGEIQVQTFDLH